mmetsp:Transcript_6507/g.14142  ORF Transcript_6507/g.14142 Transcript_6507/m.14142 type:complete len:255 (-) Transcript_6507:552-1316(-)
MTATTEVHPAWTGWSGRLQTFLPLTIRVGTDASGGPAPWGGFNNCAFVGTTASSFTSSPPPPPSLSPPSSPLFSSLLSPFKVASAASLSSLSPATAPSASAGPFTRSNFWNNATASLAERTIVPASFSSPSALSSTSPSSFSFSLVRSSFSSSLSSRTTPSDSSFCKSSGCSLKLSWKTSSSSSLSRSSMFDGLEAFSVPLVVFLALPDSMTSPVSDSSPSLLSSLSVFSPLAFSSQSSPSKASAAISVGSMIV